MDLAIAEYLRVVEDQPRDWNTANILGDLYHRSGQTNKAVDQFIRIADSLNEEGFLPKAGALYKKVLKLQPDHEHALIQGAELAASQGLLADARSYLNTVAERRRSRGDQRGAAQIRIRLGSLDPADFEARANAARARAQIGDVSDALGDLKEIAAELTAKGREADAIEVLREAAVLGPEDEEIRERLLAVYIAASDFVRARDCASTLDQFKMLAAAASAAGYADHALDALREARRLDLEDEEIRQQLVALHVASGDFASLRECAGTAEQFTALAAALDAAGHPGHALGALNEAKRLDPGNEEIQRRLMTIYIDAGDFASAIACATTAQQFKALAAVLDVAGHPEEALAAMREAGRLDPADIALRTQLGRAFVARGDMAAAAEYLTLETAGDDPALLLTIAEMQLRSGKLDEGVAIMRRLLDEDPARRDSVALLGWNLADRAPEAAFLTVGIASDVAVAQNDWPGAAAALQEFVTRVANHIPALIRLVEVCVDGNLEATMSSAQAQLADAYIEAGAAIEARYIAEDLVAREPWEKANVERFRRALVLLGEPDPDALIAERLSGQSPFTSIDLNFGDLPGFEELGLPSLREPRHAAQPQSESDVPAANERGPKDTGGSGAASHFELSTNAVDFQSIFGGYKKPAPDEEDSTEEAEVDLSVVLDDIQGSSKTPKARSSGATPSKAEEVESVFEQLRDKASKQVDAADAEYRQGVALRDAGRIDDAIQALRSASRAPRLRFKTASLLGRIYRDRKSLPQALEWFERAAEAPAPTAEEGHLLLYELADALESSGEVARALAIFVELQADAGDYKDVAERAERLAKVQTRG